MKKLCFHKLDWVCCMGFIVYSASAVITPICLLLIARELAFGYIEGGFAEVMRSLLIFAILLMSGWMASAYGKVTSLTWGTLTLGVGLLLYALTPSYSVLLLAMAMLGIGGGVIEGLINPLIQDLHPTNSGKYLNIVNGFYSMGVLLTVTIGSQILSQGVSWRWLMGALGVFAIAIGLSFYRQNNMTGCTKNASAREILRDKLAIFKNRHFWYFIPVMFIAGGAEGAFTFWSASYIQVQFNAPPSAGGIGTAFFASGMVLGRFVSGWLCPQKSLRALITTSALFGFGVSLLFPFSNSILTVYMMLLFAGLSVACFWPSIQSYAADRLDVDSTNLFILLSCAGIPGLGFMSWLMGLVASQFGLHASFFLIPVLFPILVLIITYEARLTPKCTEYSC